MNEEKNKKRTNIISFISGKGGVGKTALTAAVGKILAMMGYNVLLVDSDFFTHGLTFLLGFDSKKAGLLEIYNNFNEWLVAEKIGKEEIGKKVIQQFLEKFEIEEVCELMENLHFLQSTSVPSKKYSEQIYSEGRKIANFLKWELKSFAKSENYEFILVDTQAGSVLTTRTAVSLSDRVVIVMEPDPVSTYATENVLGELSDVLPRDSFHVINKLSVEEASAYEAIERFLRILRHLPPVPFDFEVRRAFMVRLIPVDVKKPSPFMFGVIRMMRDLLPQISERLETLEKDLEEKALQPTRLRIKEIEKDLDFLAEEEARLKHHADEIESRKERLPNLIRRYIIVGLPLVTLFYILFTYVIFGYQLISIEGTFTIGVTILSFLLSVYFAWSFLQQKTTKKISEELREFAMELARLYERRDRLKTQYESYRNLLITRSRELMLKGEEDTD